MKRDSDLAVVDIGNTSVKVATWHQLELKVRSVGHQQINWESEVTQFPTQIHGDTPKNWCIASVNEKRAAMLEESIRNHHPSASIRWITHRDIPMESSVDAPDKLGVDRFLSGFIAARLYKPPIVIISFGTAVTIDWVGADGVFAGGMILPGLQLQSDSLSLRTEALPQLQWDRPVKLSVPGKNTQSAIRGGIVLGLASAIDGFVSRYAEQNEIPSESIQTIVTGGDAETIMPHLRTRHEFAPNLVCHALMTLLSLGLE